MKPNNKILKFAIDARMFQIFINNEMVNAKIKVPIHLAFGHEFVSALVKTFFIDKSDSLFLTHRNIHYTSIFSKNSKKIYNNFSLKNVDKNLNLGSMNFLDNESAIKYTSSILGNNLSIASGFAESNKRSNSVVFCVTGDGAIEEGAFYESVNFAIIHSLPILFICENNLYSVYSGLEVRQPPKRKIYKMVQAMGISSQHGDGNDVEGVYKTVKNAKQNILKGGGPQFLEFDTYRWREHCGPNFDNDIGYRDKSEFLRWKKKDPLKKFYSLNSKKYVDKKINLIHQEILQAHQLADEADFPSLQDYNKAFKGS